MSAGIKVLPSTLQKVTISNEYAPGFLSSVSSNIQKDPAAVLKNEILNKLGANNISLGGMFRSGKNFVDIDIDIDVTNEKKATSDMAFITFMLSRYHKDHRKNGSAAKFAVSVGDTTPIEFYCMKNYTYAGDEEYTTDNDMILASILGLNATVRCLRKHNMAGMHPLSRTAITEEGVDQLCDYLYGSDRFNTELGINEGNVKQTAVKLYNTACARKCHQFTGITKYYIPELAAAQLIMGVMSSKNQSSALIDITNRNISKISRAAGSLSKSLMMDFMDFCKPPGSQYDIVEIFNAYKNKSRQRMPADYTNEVEAVQSFKTVPNTQRSMPGTSGAQGVRKQQDSIDKKKVQKELERQKREIDERQKEIDAQLNSVGGNISNDGSEGEETEDQFAEK